jgi:CHAT domain-containing protein
VAGAVGARGPEGLAEEALRLLRSGTSRGRLADRDAGIARAGEALLRLPKESNQRVELAILASRALRARWRGTFAGENLDAAVAILSDLERAIRDSEEWRRVASELACALVDGATAIQIANPVAVDGGATVEILSRAGDLADRALAATPRDSPVLADRQYAVGLVLWARGDLDGAAEQLRSAVSLDPAPASRWMLARTLATRYDLNRNDPDRAEACRLLEQLSADVDRAPREAFEAARFHLYWATQRGEWSEAGDAALRGLALRERLRRAQREDLAERRWLLEAGGIPSQGAHALACAGRAEQAVAALDAALVTEFADRLRLDEPASDVTFDAVARTARAEPLVYLVVAPSGGVALVVVGDQVETVPLPELNSDALWTKLQRYGESYRWWQSSGSPGGRQRWMGQVEEMLQWLWSVAMACVLDILPAATPAMTLVTDGVLGLLPLHAAGVDGISVADRVQVRFAPNARALSRAQLAAQATPTSALIVADAGVSGMPPLPFALAEAEAAAALLPEPELLTNEGVTLANVARSLPGHDVLHFACHGSARFDDPRLSALFFADGESLTLGRILDIRLDGTRLAVLSACESGMQDVVVPEDKMSLPTGVLLAGVSGVIASLWAVGDRSTMLLMTRLHELWTQNDGDPCAALRAAQLWLRDTTNGEKADWWAERSAALREKHARPETLSQVAGALAAEAADERSFQHPFHWAGFVYHGA